MPLDIHHLGARHCFACIQWDGRRTFEQASKTIRVDAGSEGRCRVKHANVKGTHYCELFYALK